MIEFGYMYLWIMVGTLRSSIVSFWFCIYTIQSFNKEGLGDQSSVFKQKKW